MSIELADVPSAESSGPSIRDHIESAVAAHNSGPDISSIVSGAMEQRDREIRQRDRRDVPGGRLWEGEARERRRADIRNAVSQHRIQSSQQASAPIQPQKPGAVPVPGAPASWDSTAKTHWDAIPSEVRLAVQRDHAGFKNGYDERFREFERILAPAREVYSQQGLKDHEAVAALFQWELRFRNPETRMQAFHELAQQYGVDLGSGQHHQDHPYVSPEVAQETAQRLSRFAQGRVHFEQVRETMGMLLYRFPERFAQTGGGTNLDKLYRDACKAEGISNLSQRPQFHFLLLSLRVHRQRKAPAFVSHLGRRCAGRGAAHHDHPKSMTDAQRIAGLERQVKFLTQRLDETRRAFGLSSIIDEQLLAINARKDALSRGHAA